MSPAQRLIRLSEGLRLHAYPDPATKGEPYTIGFGRADGTITPDMTITTETAEAWLMEDIAKMEAGVLRLVKVPLTDNQVGALVSFAYNCGLANLKKSTLLKKVNGGDINGAAGEFSRWVTASGIRLTGLVKRRELERQLFLTPDK